MQRSGFTLIELLIVIATIMIINLAVVSFFITSQETTQRGSQSLNRVGFARSTMTIMNKDIRASSGLLPVYQGYKTSDTCLILNGKQTIIYFADKNVFRRLVVTTPGKKIWQDFKLLDNVDTIRYTYDTPDINQVKRITVSLTCNQTKFMEKNNYTITSLVKLRN